jgi:uncharacterized surface protein with fasciclin (FAS1) repeats
MDPEQHLSVLAFTNEAFEAQPKMVKDRVMAKQGCMSDLAWELTMRHTICSAAIEKAALVSNLKNAHLNATRDEEGNLHFQQVKVTKPDRMATNGLVHVVDGVPLLNHMKDVVDAAKERGGRVFAQQLARNNLLDLAQGKDAVTLFVPPDDTLTNLPEGSDVAQLLKNHIVDNLVEISPANRETLMGRKPGRR